MGVFPDDTRAFAVGFCLRHADIEHMHLVRRDDLPACIRKEGLRIAHPDQQFLARSRSEDIPVLPAASRRPARVMSSASVCKTLWPARLVETQLVTSGVSTKLAPSAASCRWRRVIRQVVVGVSLDVSCTRQSACGEPT